MKNRDWLNKPEDHANRDDGDTKARKQRWEAFERVAADPGKYWREDGFDEIVSWEAPVGARQGRLPLMVCCQRWRAV